MGMSCILSRLNIYKGERNKCLGLISMRERVALQDGTFVIESSQRGGTTIRTKIPLKEV